MANNNGWYDEGELLKNLRREIGYNTLKKLKKEQLVNEILQLRNEKESWMHDKQLWEHQRQDLQFVINELQKALRATNGVPEPQMSSKGEKYYD